MVYHRQKAESKKYTVYKFCNIERKSASKETHNFYVNKKGRLGTIKAVQPILRMCHIFMAKSVETLEQIKKLELLSGEITTS